MQFEYRLSHDGTHTSYRAFNLEQQPDGTWLTEDHTPWGRLQLTLGAPTLMTTMTSPVPVVLETVFPGVSAADVTPQEIQQWAEVAALTQDETPAPPEVPAPAPAAQARTTATRTAATTTTKRTSAPTSAARRKKPTGTTSRATRPTAKQP